MYSIFSDTWLTSGIEEKDHRLNTPRPGTALTRPTENTCGNVCASTSWGCDYSPHREPFVRRKTPQEVRDGRLKTRRPGTAITRPTEDPLSQCLHDQHPVGPRDRKSV